MKKFIYSAAALVFAFFAASCQQENLEPVGGNTVTYTVQVPDALATKADGDGFVAYYEVYRQGEVEDGTKSPVYEGSEPFENGSAKIDLEFVKNQNFVVLFWAQKEGVTAYNTGDLRNVALGTLTANQENYEVFAGVDEVSNCVSSNNGNVELVRPIAQLNIATDAEGLKLGATDVTLISSFVTVKGLSTTYNVYNKAVSETLSDVQFSVAAVPAGKLGTTDYTYVAMNYIGFIDANGTTVNVDFTVKTSEGDIAHSVSSVPVKPNYKTNIIGNLITATDNYQVTLDAWETEETNVEVVAVSTAQELQEAIENIQAGEEGNIILEGDIDLGSLFAVSTQAVTKAGNAPLPIVILAEKTMTLDLNGFTITTPWEDETAGKHYYAFDNKGTLNIVDSKVNGKIKARGIFNYGKMTLESGTIEACDGNGGYGVRNYEGAEFVMNGGTVATIYEDGDAPGNGYDATTLRVDEGATATINGGTINNICNFTVAIDNLGTVTINGGTFTSVHTTVANKASMTIEGGSFTCNGLEGITAHALWADAGTTTINGGTFDGKDNYNGFNVDASAGAVVNITGGKFLPVHSGSLYGEGTINVTGGEFFDDPSKRVAEGYFAKQEDSKYVVYKAVAAIGETMYKSIEDAIAAVEESATIKVLCGAEMAGNAKITAGKTVVIDLNGCTISAVDNTEKSYQIIQNTGNLTIKNSAENTAKMTVKATINSGWNRYSAVIANTVGGNLTVEGNVVLEHLGGTDMAYGIDNLTNGKGTYAVTTINGATVKSPYRAVRQFLNGVEATNELYVKAGSELRGDNKSIFFHDPSKNANTGKLVVEEGARLYGDVYLFVTAGSTEWPVEVSIAASTLADASEVLSGNVPSGYAIIKDNETWKVVDNAIATAAEFKAFRNKINAGEKFSDKTAYLVADIDLNGEEWTPIGTKNNHFHGTFDGQGHTISNFKITQKHDGDNAQAALFGTVSLTTVFKNFNIDNIQVLYPADYNGDYYGAAVIGTFYGKVTLQNINVTKSTIQGNNKVAGLIAHDGSSSEVLIENCNVNGCTIETKNEEDGGNVGGLVGLFQNTKATVKNCSVTGCTINAINSSDSGKRGNALLVGGTIDSGTPDLYVKIENCKVADNTFKETGRVNYVSPYGDGTLVGGAREGDSYLIGKVEIDGVVYPQN